MGRREQKRSLLDRFIVNLLTLATGVVLPMHYGNNGSLDDQ